MSFTFSKLSIPEVVLCTPNVLKDSRGFFLEVYNFAHFKDGGLGDVFVQDNASASAKGVLRGLHFQVEPMAQSKLIRCVKGAIFDVAVDLRQGSPSFGAWVAEELSAKNFKQLYIPPGFAHGFQALSDGAEVSYKVSAFYSPEHEFGVHGLDEELAIDWPIRDSLGLSPKDEALPALADLEIFPIYQG
jgi:dTDP-4-dehydrorhamnose 3,5-epimerase